MFYIMFNIYIFNLFKEPLAINSMAYISITKGLCTLITHIDYFFTDNDIFWIQDIIILYDHNTYFLSSPVCQLCLSDLYRKLTEHFRPELFDDSVIIVAFIELD
jgi:hypothetical protein